MFQHNQALALRMMEHYCDFTSFLFYEISSLAYNDAITKVAIILNSLASTSLCKENKLYLAQTDIASLAGTSKVQIARAYKFLKSNGIIDVSRNCITILDYEQLLMLIDDDEF